MPLSVQFLQTLDKLEPDLKSVIFELLAELERNREESVIKREFLTFAQKTDENFQKVWKAIGELTEAQKRTEQRLEELAQAQQRTEQRVEALAEAQQRTEQRLEELAQAQQRTEQRIEALAEAQQRTEQRLEELAQAQQRTEQRVEALAEALKQLTLRVDDLSVQVGGISNTIGYGLEDRSYPILKKVIQRDFGVDVERLFRKNIVYSRDRFDEVNIYGEGMRNGEKVCIVGECKAQFGPNDVRRYIARLERVSEHLGGQIISLTLAYHYHPQAEESLSAEGIKYYWSYDIVGESSL